MTRARHVLFLALSALRAAPLEAGKEHVYELARLLAEGLLLDEPVRSLLARQQAHLLHPPADYLVPALSQDAGRFATLLFQPVQLAHSRSSAAHPAALRNSLRRASS